MRNIEIVKIYRFLELIKKEETSIKTRAKLLKNLKLINPQVDIIKSLEESIVTESMKNKINEYNKKRDSLIEEYKLEGKRLDETDEDIVNKFKELEVEYKEVFDEKRDRIQQHNEFLYESVDEEIVFNKFTIEEIESLKINNDYDEILEYLIEL